MKKMGLFIAKKAPQDGGANYFLYSVIYI